MSPCETSLRPDKCKVIIRSSRHDDGRPALKLIVDPGYPAAHKAPVVMKLVERKRFEEERRLELVQLTNDVERGAGPVKVTLERSDAKFHTVRYMTFDFPYHKGLVAAIKRAFRNA